VPTIIAFVTPFYMTRCWMLTFAGKPRNQHLHDHAHESPVLYGPLIVLAILSIIGGYGLNVRELLIASHRRDEEDRRIISSGDDLPGFETAWPPYDPTVKPKTPELLEGGAAPPQAHKPEEAVEHHSPDAAGWHLVHTIVFWAFIVGIGLGVIIYWNGYWIAGPLTASGPLAPVRIWLYRRMYFDELYRYVFVGIVMALSRFSEWFDRKIVDGLVNGAARLVNWTSRVAGLNDKYVVDGRGERHGRADPERRRGRAGRRSPGESECT
jgi:NADH-quinone oxidoreductase subunit L